MMGSRGLVNKVNPIMSATGTSQNSFFRFFFSISSIKGGLNLWFLMKQRNFLLNQI